MDGDPSDAEGGLQMSSAGEETFHLANAPPPRARARARPPGSEASWTHLKRQLEIRLIPFAQLILVYLRYTFLNKIIIIIFMSASRLC